MTEVRAAPQPRGRKRRSAQRRGLILLAGLVLVVIVVVIVNRRVSGPGTAKVYAAEVGRQTIHAIVSGPGQVVPEKRVKISSGVMGRIVHLAAVEGRRVAEGDLLVQIDPTQYESRVREAEASLEWAGARVVLEESRLERLEQELSRQEKLKASHLVSETDIETVETEVKVARAELEAARHRVVEARARLASARDDLSKTTIRAPLTGVISSLEVEEGEIVIVGTMNYPGTVLMTISDLSQMEVEADIDETDILDVVLGQGATVYVDALGDSTLEGTVVDIASSAYTVGRGTAEEATNFKVRVRIAGGRFALKPGMSANVEIETDCKSDVLCVPIQAVVKRRAGSAESGGPDETAADRPDEEDEEKQGVFLVEDGRALFRRIETGISDETDVEVISELEEGQRVVTGPYKVLARLKDGRRVRVEEEEGEESERAD